MDKLYYSSENDVIQSLLDISFVSFFFILLFQQHLLLFSEIHNTIVRIRMFTVYTLFDNKHKT